MVKFSSPIKINKVGESDLPTKDRISPSRFMRKTSGRKTTSWKKLSSNSSVSSISSANPKTPANPKEVSNYAKTIDFSSSSFSQASEQARILPISPKDRRTPSISVRSTRSTRMGNCWHVVDDLINHRNRLKNGDGEAMAPLLRSGITIPNSDSSTIGNQSEAEVITKPTIVMESYNYYLVSGNRQVTYFPYSGNPYNCMNVLDYDVFPVYLGKDKCLIKVEVRTIVYRVVTNTN